VVGDAALPPDADAGAFGDLLRERLGSGAAVVHLQIGDDREAILAVVTDDWIGRGIRAGDLVKTASRVTGSGGGGRPHLAQGGVGDSGRVGEALAAAARQAREAAAAGSTG
jgi:alanyl-tRNA synthetase